MCDLEKFKTCWKTSIAARLLVPEPNKTQLYLGKESGNLASIAYVACQRDTIHLLDELFNKWQIGKKSTKEFKGKLKENWLELEEGRKQRNVCNDTLSAISELSVASYLDSEGYSIKNLAAWGEEKADITCEKDGQKYFFEVKYFPDSPEFNKSRIKASKKDGYFCGSVPAPSRTLNYIFYRLGEAIIQLDGHLSCKENKIVFFVFDDIAEDTGRKVFEKEMPTFEKWHRTNGKIVGLPPNHKKEVLEKSPSEWLSSGKRLMIGTMERWKIKGNYSA